MIRPRFTWDEWGILLGAILCLLALVLSGCKETERTAARFEVAGTLNGQPLKLRVVGGSDSVSQSSMDPAAIADAMAVTVGAAIKAAIPAWPTSQPAPTTDWPMLLSGVGAAATTAATGYLALKKREQMRQPVKAKA